MCQLQLFAFNTKQEVGSFEELKLFHPRLVALGYVGGGKTRKFNDSPQWGGSGW